MDLSRLRQAYSLKANLRSLWNRPGERYAPIDGLRALSMLWVVLTHLCLGLARAIPYDAYLKTMDRLPSLYSWVLHGELALDSFFVISGFLIGAMLLHEEHKTGRILLGRFYARRYLRLMPAYAVALLVLLAAGVEGPVKAHYVWANILYVNNFLPQAHMFMDWSWSLAVEEQFYLLLPFFLLGVFFRARRRVVPLAVLFLLSFGLIALVLSFHRGLLGFGFGENFIASAPHYSSEYFDALYVNLYTRFGPFVLGLWLAWLATAHEAAMKKTLAERNVGTILLGVGLAIVVASLAVPAFDQRHTFSPTFLFLYMVLQRNVWSIGVSLIMVAVLYPASAPSRVLARLLSARIWFPIAQLSYCAYLFHLAFILPGLVISHALLHRGVPFELATSLSTLGAADFTVAYALTLGISFLFGAFMYLALERPFLNLRPR